MTTRPVDAPVTCSWQCHKDRTNPPSYRPGTDYGCAHGTPVRAMAAGRVVFVRNALLDTFGRFVRIVHDQLGVVAEYGHLSGIHVREGQHVDEGETIAASGASGFLDDWYYGPHLHHNVYRIGDGPPDSFDAEALYPATAGGGQTTFPTPTVRKDEDMIFIEDKDGKRGRAVTIGDRWVPLINGSELELAAKHATQKLYLSTKDFDTLKNIYGRGARTVTFSDKQRTDLAATILATLPSGALTVEDVRAALDGLVLTVQS